METNTTASTTRPSRRRVWIGATVTAAAVAVGVSAYAFGGAASAATGDSDETEQVLEPGKTTETVSEPAATDDGSTPTDADSAAEGLEAAGGCYVSVSGGTESSGDEPVVETHGGPSEDCPAVSITSLDDGSVDIDGSDDAGATPVESSKK